VNDGTASAIVDLASDLVRGPTVSEGSAIRPAFRDLCFRHIHHGGERPQIRDDRVCCLPVTKVSNRIEIPALLPMLAGLAATT
jgi:hypothetical protein